MVPLHNGRELIGPGLESVPAGVEIIVVDDLSTDGAPDLVRERFPQAVVLRNDRNLGFATTTNRGLRAATRPVRVVLNSDARFTPGALDLLAAAFADPLVGIVGPRLVFADGTHQTSAGTFPRLMTIVTGSFLLNELFRLCFPDRRCPFELGLARRDHARDRDVDWVSGACLAIRDTCFAELGGFDEGYFMYNEETDLCWRARQAGWNVRLVANAKVVHLGGASSGSPALRARNFIASESRFMARAYGEGILPRWRLARIAGGALKVVVLAPVAMVSRRARTRLRWQAAAVRYAVAAPTGSG